MPACFTSVCGAILQLFCYRCEIPPASGGVRMVGVELVDWLRERRAATFPHRHEPPQVRHVHPGIVVQRGPLAVAVLLDATIIRRVLRRRRWRCSATGTGTWRTGWPGSQSSGAARTPPRLKPRPRARPDLGRRLTAPPPAGLACHSPSPPAGSRPARHRAGQRWLSGWPRSWRRDRISTTAGTQGSHSTRDQAYCSFWKRHRTRHARSGVRRCHLPGQFRGLDG